MTESAHGRPVPLACTTADTWVLHSALTALLDDGETASDAERRTAATLIERVETRAEPRFTHRELRVLRSALLASLTDAPSRDRPLLRGLLAQITTTLGPTHPRLP